MEVALDLHFTPPLEPGNLFGHLVATAVPGVEAWRDGAYERSVWLPGGPGVLVLRPPGPGRAGGADRAEGRIDGRVLLARRSARDVVAATALARRLLDLDAEPAVVRAALAADPALAPLVAAAPGRRVPGAPDAAEMAVRAVLGQQVSTAAARTHTGRLVAAHGEPLPAALVRPGGPTHLFPAPQALTRIDPETLAMPRTRRATLLAVVALLAEGAGIPEPTSQPVTGFDLAAFAALPGIGPWTTATVAMRALGDRDAFLPTDLGVRAAARALGLPDGARDLVRRAEAWRPWRAYAVQYLWSVLDHPINQVPRTQA